MVGHAEPWVETFTGKVGEFAAVPGAGQAFGDLPGEGVGKGMRIVVADDDQGLHEGSPEQDVRRGLERYILKVSYDW
ncbi:hypothetical protein D3C81_1841010 [compost metagenome]